MKIISKTQDSAVVDSGGTRREISISLLKGIKTGDYVIVHAGFAIEKLDQKRAKETLDLFKHIEPNSFAGASKCPAPGKT